MSNSKNARFTHVTFIFQNSQIFIKKHSRYFSEFSILNFCYIMMIMKIQTLESDVELKVQFRHCVIYVIVYSSIYSQDAVTKRCTNHNVS